MRVGNIVTDKLVTIYLNWLGTSKEIYTDFKRRLLTLSPSRKLTHTSDPSIPLKNRTNTTPKALEKTAETL